MRGELLWFGALLLTVVALGAALWLHPSLILVAFAAVVLQAAAVGNLAP